MIGLTPSPASIRLQAGASDCAGCSRLRIGFAILDLGDFRLGIVNVPSHERLVKNMLAGATGVDQVVLMVAAPTWATWFGNGTRLKAIPRIASKRLGRKSSRACPD